MKINIQIILLVSFFSINNISGISQNIKVNADADPLSNVLFEIALKNNINISYDDKILSNILISNSKSYSSISDALDELLLNTGLEYEYVDDVYIVFPKNIFPRKTISGIIVDKTSREALPYSNISINSWPTTSDLSGNFSYTVNSTDSIFDIRVTHLGYYIKDTISDGKANIYIELTPSVIGLKEVEIIGEVVEKSTQFGNKPGLMKLNHKIAHFLPGYGDNSVFNLLRLMPGILASGEQTNELIIWGSYAGQSQVLFDGFTVFGLKNFNDNISSFNPLLAKDIEIHKGGYEAKYGGRVGGIVNIVGKNGNYKKPFFNFNINNMTLNAMGEIPIAKKSSLIIAFRHTYYDLYKAADMTGLINNPVVSDSTNNIDFNIEPRYLFRDVNMKYSTNISKNDLFFISLHAAEDNFRYSIDELFDEKNYLNNSSEQNIQTGASAYYSRNWQNGIVSSFKISYSSLDTDFQNDFKIKYGENENTEYISDDVSSNFINEINIKQTNKISLNKIHLLETGIEFVQNSIKYSENSFNALISSYNKSANRVTFYLQDNIWATNKLNIIGGLRYTYLFNLGKNIIEPRLSATYSINSKFKIVSAFGYYSQSIVISSVLDDLGNYKYLWTIADNNDVPVLNSTHIVLGGSYSSNGFTFSAESYYKTTSGITRYYNLRNYNIQDIYHGSSTSKGIDFLIKKEFRKHSAWIAYSLSKTNEKFKYDDKSISRPAPQDQRHEIKLAMMLNFNPVYISSNYIYGSGFPYGNALVENDNKIYPYKRLDISAIYKFIDKKIVGEAGVSILNVLNSKNIKYRSFEKVPANQTSGINIYGEAIPFTPTLYLKISI